MSEVVLVIEAGEVKEDVFTLNKNPILHLAFNTRVQRRGVTPSAAMTY